MGKFYLAYMDTWGDETKKVVFHIPDDSSEIPSIERVSSVTAAIAIDSRFDPTITLFAPTSDYVQKLTNFGFTDVRLYDEYKGRNAYIAENAWIEFVRTSNAIKYHAPNINIGNYDLGTTSGTGSTRSLYNAMTGHTGGCAFSITRFSIYTTFNASIYGAGSSAADIATFWSLATPYVPPTPSTDPYDWNGHSHTSGTFGGDHTITQDNIDYPTLPSITAGDAGFVSIWTPTLEQIQRLAGYMWCNNPLTADFWLKLLASPLDLIFGLSIIPVDLTDPNSPYTLKHAGLVLGYVATLIDMNYIDEQFIEVDMGSIDVEEWAGAYLDYDPYTKFSIFLPYIGARDLNADDIMDRTVSLKYRIDLATGACVAMIKCTSSDSSVDSIFYTFSGNCAAQIPVTASQQQELIRSIINIGTAVAQVAAGAPAPSGVIKPALKIAGDIGVGIGSSAEHALGLKSNYAHSGVMDSTVGFLGPQQPYLIVNRPRLAIPEDQNIYMGYPSFITETLGDLSGYTEVEVLHLDRIPCTETEMSEIAELLVGGAYF